MRSKFKKSISLFLSVVMAMSGMGKLIKASAGEVVTETTIVAEGETAEIKEASYFITLPYYEEYSYIFDKEHLKEPVEEKQDIILSYARDERVEISLLQIGEQKMGEIRLLDQKKYEIPFEWKEENTLRFQMPAKDIWMEIVPAIPGMESVRGDMTVTEPAQTENRSTEIGQEGILATENVHVLEEVPTIEETLVPDITLTEISTESSEIFSETTEHNEETEETENIVTDDPVTELQTETQTEELSDVMTVEPEETDSEEEKNSYAYQEETESDGLPLQGNIVQVDMLLIPFDTWEFDQYSDFRNIPYDTETCTIEYISDDIIYDVPGIYSSIYRVTDNASGKFWFVLRPIQVSDKSEEFTEPETRELQEESETEAYSIYVLENSDVLVTLDQENYQAGERVEVTVTADEGYQVTDMKARKCDDSTEVMTLAEEVEVEKKEEKASYAFIMPESDVLLTVATVGEVMELAATTENEDPVPDKFKLINTGNMAFVPSSYSSNPSASSAATQIRRVVFYDEDGGTVTRQAYCIQPNLETPPGGTYDKDSNQVELLETGSKEKNLAKCLYYMYGGPAWGKTINYADGSGSVNMKTLLEEKGCSSTEHYYAVTHYVLGYFYVGANGDWNANTGVQNVMNSTGEEVIKSIAGYIRKLPVPKTELSAVSVASQYNNGTGVNVSNSVTYKAIDENTATLTLPAGITLVNETTGRSSTGKVTIDGGTKFHLEATPDISGTGTYTLKCKYAVDFTAMALKTSGKQDVGFSYYSGDKTLTLTIEWQEVPKNKAIEIQKYDIETGQPVARGKGATFANAEYSVYADAACKELVEVLTTNAAGYAKSSELPITVYYIKETKAPSGYTLDQTIYTIEMNKDDGLGVYTVSSNESPDLKTIEVQKEDRDTGLTRPINDKASFAGAQYGIYADTACTQIVETLITDGTGYAKSSELLIGTYYVKEIKAPQGYLLDETVYTVDMNCSDGIQVYPVNSVEQVIRKPIEIQKVDSETGMALPQNNAVTFSGAEYTIYTDQNCTEQLEVLVTDERGYAKSSDLPVGIYYIRETRAPIGYQPDTNMYTVKVGDDTKAFYRIESPEQITRGGLSIMKFLDDSYDGSILQDRVESGILSGICFILTHEDKTVPVVRIITDNYGYAATEPDALVYGTWYITEDPDTTPEGYEGITDTKVNISEEGVELKYVISNNQPAAQIKLIKKDSHTGNGVSISGGKFQIFDDEGNIVTMPNHLNYAELTDTFTLDENGIIYFTNALKAGKYQIKELEAPEGYLIGETLSFSVKENHDYTHPMVIEFADEPQMGKIRIRKLDGDTGALLGEDFYFDIYAAEDIIDASGAVRTIEKDGNTIELKKGTLVSGIQTGADGIAETENLYLGSYIVKESRAGEYYAISQAEYPITLTADANVKDVITEVEVKNEKTKLELLKVDSSAEEKVLKGIRFRIYSSNDVETEKARQVAEAVEELRISQNPEREAFLAQQSEALAYFDAEQHSEEERANFLAVLVKELEAFDDGLQKARDALEAQLVKDLEISDYSVLGTEYITDSEGRIRLEDLKHGCTYFVYETGTLPGYNLDTGVYEFTVDENGLIDGRACYNLKIANQPNQLEITKMDITGGRELSGATLTIKDSEGNVVETWISTDEAHRVLGLPAGTYTLIEEQAPEGYAIAESIIFTLTDSLQVQQVIMYDDLIKIQISKKDITGGKELPGAKLTITNSEGTVVEEWISTEEPHMVNLAAGTYKLTEIAAPEKYAKAETITFEVTGSMEVQSVVMYDKPIEVSISKKDITNDEELFGAQLIVRDKDRNTVEEWISSPEPHMMNLAAGTYTLTEITAPQGYEVAEMITFDVTDSMEVQHVTMYDTPKEQTVDLTGKEDTKTTMVGSGAPPYGSGGTTVTSSPVQTGDPERYTVAVLLIIGGIFILIGVAADKKRRKKK